MLGCYRKGEAADEEIFTRGVISVLSGYPEAVVRVVTNPARGLPGKLKWLPTIAEVREACDAEFAPTRREQERQARIAAQRREALPGPAEESRAIVGQRFNALAKELGTRLPNGTVMPPTELEKAVLAGDDDKAHQLAREAFAGVRLSFEALSKFREDEAA